MTPPQEMDPTMRKTLDVLSLDDVKDQLKGKLNGIKLDERALANKKTKVMILNELRKIDKKHLSAESKKKLQEVLKGGRAGKIVKGTLVAGAGVGLAAIGVKKYVGTLSPVQKLNLANMVVDMNIPVVSPLVKDSRDNAVKEAAKGATDKVKDVTKGAMDLISKYKPGGSPKKGESPTPEEPKKAA